MSSLDMGDWDTAPGGLLVFSEAGIILDLNTTLLHWLNYADKQLLEGQGTAIIFSIADRIFHQTHFLPLLHMQGHADEIFFRLKTRDGNEVPVLCNAVRKIKGDKALIHCLFLPAVQRSKYEQELITARKEAQEALARNSALIAAKSELEEKAMELDRNMAELKKVNDDLLQFSKVISHDLQEPIRKIAVFSDKVAKEAKYQLDESIIRQLEKINRECLVLRQLAANLERFITLNARAEKPTEVDLNEVISIAFRTAMDDISEAALHFTSGPLPAVAGLLKQLEMLFYNIFRNSRDFRHADRPIEVTVEHFIVQQNFYQESKNAYRYVDFVRILILDNGYGFEHNPGSNYFTIQKKTTQSGFGLTFGLAFASKIVSNHQGSIAIASTIGKGTSVVITLPLRHDPIP